MNNYRFMVIGWLTVWPMTALKGGNSTMPCIFCDEPAQ